MGMWACIMVWPILVFLQFLSMEFVWPTFLKHLVLQMSITKNKICKIIST